MRAARVRVFIKRDLRFLIFFVLLLFKTDMVFYYSNNVTLQIKRP